MLYFTGTTKVRIFIFSEVAENDLFSLSFSETFVLESRVVTLIGRCRNNLFSFPGHKRKLFSDLSTLRRGTD